MTRGDVVYAFGDFSSRHPMTVISNTYVAEWNLWRLIAKDPAGALIEQWGDQGTMPVPHPSLIYNALAGMAEVLSRRDSTREYAAVDPFGRVPDDVEASIDVGVRTALPG